MALSNGLEDNDSSIKCPKYVVEHLATFKVSKDNGILRPSDGMKRLIQHGEHSGIWPLKMLMSFESEWVLIMDYESGNTIEGFPASLIQQPTAFISEDPNEVFNNILVFIVGGSLSHTDMHIFQCTTVSALNLVVDLQDISKGKVIKKQHEKYPLTPVQKTQVQNKLKDQYGLKEMNSIVTNNNQFDIDLLNNCVIDIEKFISRLNYTTAASQELETRRKIGEQSENNFGEGLLSVRSQRPKETEFLDILEKLKFSLNLITKLRNQIQDPQTPIHHLFTSLELILEIAKEECDEKNLPEQVISPLFCSETIELLSKTLSPKEKKMWHSCGASWQIPKEKWQGRSTNYHPIFSDGWSPDMPKEAEDNISLISLPLTLRNASDNESLITITPNDEIWLNKLENKRSLIALVNFNRAAGNDKELTVYKGEYLEILNSSRKWWRARNCNSKIGYVPYTILTMHELPELDHISCEEKKVVSSKKSSQAEEIMKKAMERRSISLPNPPPPPPPMPPSEPTTPYATLKKSTAIVVAAEINSSKVPLDSSKRFTPDNKNMTQDKLTNELQLIFALRKNRDDINIKQLPDVYIDERSTAKDVTNWLRQKEFSENVVKKLDGVNGRDLFGIPLSTLIEYFGAKIGKRLDGMIIIQKKYCKFQTAGKSELKAILARARQKTGEKDEVDNHNADELF